MHLVLAFLILLLPIASQALTMTTFNMKWFGLGGHPSGNLNDEYRDSSILKFSQTPQAGGFLDSDILAFEEVVDVQRLRRLVPSHECKTYDHDDPKHQFVVLCLRRGLSLRVDGGDDNFALEEMATGRLRPGVHGLVTDSKGRSLAHVIAVHLKAGEGSSNLRAQQLRVIKNFIETKINDGVPVILAGDLNLFEDKGDLTHTSEMLKSGRHPLHLVDNPNPTFRSSYGARRFDWFFVSSGTSVEQPFVPNVCNPQVRDGRGFEDPKYYQRQVSDHCPVKLTMNLNN